MRSKPWTPVLTRLFSALLPVIVMVGCGGAGDDRVADSATQGFPPSARVASVDVTYYYLPG